MGDFSRVLRQVIKALRHSSQCLRHAPCWLRGLTEELRGLTDKSRGLAEESRGSPRRLRGSPQQLRGSSNCLGGAPYGLRGVSQCNRWESACFCHAELVMSCRLLAMILGIVDDNQVDVAAAHGGWGASVDANLLALGRWSWRGALFWLRGRLKSPLHWDWPGHAGFDRHGWWCACRCELARTRLVESG